MWHRTYLNRFFPRHRITNAPKMNLMAVLEAKQGSARSMP